MLPCSQSHASVFVDVCTYDMHMYMSYRKLELEEIRPSGEIALLFVRRLSRSIINFIRIFFFLSLVAAAATRMTA